MVKKAVLKRAKNLAETKAKIKNKYEEEDEY